MHGSRFPEQEYRTHVPMTVSLRGAKRRGNPLDFAGTTNGRFRSISGIATPVCALVRNDVFSFGAGSFCVPAQGRPQSDRPTSLPVGTPLPGCPDQRAQGWGTPGDGCPDELALVRYPTKQKRSDPSFRQQMIPTIRGVTSCSCWVLSFA